MGVFERGVTEAWVAVATFVPKLVVFLVIALVGWLVAAAAAKVARILFARFGFTRLVAKSGIGEIATKSKIDVVGVLGKLVYYFILLVFVQLALGVFGPNAVKDLIDQVVLFLPRLAVAIVLVLVAAAIGRAAGEAVRGALGSHPASKIAALTASGFCLGLGVIAALSQLGIALSVTLPVLIAVLATAGGVIIVGVGGGLIQPMRQRWNKWLVSAESQFSADAPASPGNGVAPETNGNGTKHQA